MSLVGRQPPRVLVEVVSDSNKGSDNYPHYYQDKPGQYVAIGSPAFPGLMLTAVQILERGR